MNVNNSVVKKPSFFALKFYIYFWPEGVEKRYAFIKEKLYRRSILIKWKKNPPNWMKGFEIMDN